MHVGELQTSLPTDVLAAFAYHAKDLVALHNDVQGFVPTLELRYYEKLWPDR